MVYLIALLALVVAGAVAWAAWMPGSSIKGPLPELTEQER